MLLSDKYAFMLLSWLYILLYSYYTVQKRSSDFCAQYVSLNYIRSPLVLYSGTGGGAKGSGPGSQAGESHPSGPSKGIGFARLDSHDNCERLIERYGGKVLPGASEPLIVKYADANKNRRFGQNANSPNSSSSSGSIHNNNLQGLAEIGALGGLGMGHALGGGMLQEAALANVLGLGVGVGVPNGGISALGQLVNQESLKTAFGLLLQQQQQTSAAHMDLTAGSNAVNTALLPQLLQQQQQQQQQQTQGVNANQLLLEATLRLLAQPAATSAATAQDLNLQQLSAYLAQQSTATALARQQQQQQQQQQALMLQAQLQAMMGAQAHGHAMALGSTQAHAAQGAALDAQQQSLLQLQSQSIPSFQHINLAYSIAEVCTCFYCTSSSALLHFN